MVQHSETPPSVLFTKDTKAIVWGLQHRAVQVRNEFSVSNIIVFIIIKQVRFVTTVGGDPKAPLS